MAYEIEWTAAALRELRKLDKQTGRRIVLAVTTLGADPRPPGCRALAGRPAGVMRIRVGDHRVIYQVEDTKVLVTIVRVAHRREVYRKS
ncbi:type II toxin-antitoxin system RelE family toxin [Saccharothrix hoggarensis]|uniref:Type II toxin-antitoxin system RelE/ParE family toxin n=1 Tax=Saccharothrix hoggarensis TaxID=913853 RepID=A0ABW3QMB6_9PSEU